MKLVIEFVNESLIKKKKNEFYDYFATKYINKENYGIITFRNISFCLQG